MKLFRFGEPGRERPGVIDHAGTPRDLSGEITDYDERFFGQGGMPHVLQLLARTQNLPALDLNGQRLGPPIARPSKFIAVGLNYADHATETGAQLPSEPKIFMKASSALCGVYDDVKLPRGSLCTDYEVELAVVIKSRASYVEEAQAWDYVAGCTVCNDYSEREFQKNRSGQFVKGKSADTFAPLGPYLVSSDEARFEDARLFCSVNGEPRQDARTSALIFGVPRLIACISQYMTLLPGDVITTGTPAGVGMGRVPPSYLRAGDVVEYGIEGIGAGRQRVIGQTMTER
ncbi:MAG TPA: fumarylacetoacetate hydrolase family protein [Polyangiaceae bacterium]|nr:fumarylacetoacetate hydrolase family protein [Polyangiaceae bacterium]